MLRFVLAFASGTELKVLQIQQLRSFSSTVHFVCFSLHPILFSMFYINQSRSPTGTLVNTYLYRPRLNKISSLLMIELVNA